MIVAKSGSLSALHATAFFAATAIAISTLAGCSAGTGAGPSTGDAEVLPFEGLDFPSNVDVDSAGNVFLTDWGNDRVLRLDQETNDQAEIPFQGLDSAEGVAVGSDGTVYVSEGKGIEDNVGGRILEMPTDGTPQKILTSGKDPRSLAVDESGVVYFFEVGEQVILKRTPGVKNSEIAVALSQTNFPDLDGYFNDVAIGSDGELVAITGLPNPRIFDVTSAHTLKERAVLKGQDRFPIALDINKAGDMVILDSKGGKARILMLSSGATEPIELSFGELNKPSDVAIDDPGNVYVADRNNHRVLKLQANV